MASALRLYYWDACIFYEHLNDEQTEPLKKQAVAILLAENKGKRNRICTSVITHIEVIPKKLAKEMEQSYWDKFQSTFFYDIDIDRNVLNLSREIKDYYYKPADDAGGHRMMSTGDSIHLATAIIHDAYELHTRDKNTKGGNVKLLGLPESSPNGKLCGQYPLRIISPQSDQGRLFDETGK